MSMNKTRLHSNRIHTTSPSMHCTGGVWSQGGMPGPEGGVCSREVTGPRGNGSAPEGGVWSQGVVSQHALRQTPHPHVNRILDTCY